jgi:pyrroloquinoline quinone biosynthesis protein D
MLRHDRVRGTDLVLLPERVLTLNPTAAAILRLCDGDSPVDAIVRSLESDYRRDGLQPSVLRVLQRLGEQGAIEW